MTNILSSYSREELERKLLHMTSFLAYKLAVEYMQLAQPETAIIRIQEAEEEHTWRTLELIVCLYPAWDIVEKTHPGYDAMKEWITKNHENALMRPCECDGCKK